MATSLKELIVTYQANAKPVLDALNQIDAKIRQTSKNLKSVGDSFVNVGKDISLSLSAPLGLLSVKALQASADFETLKMQMEVLTGSAEEGDRVFRRLVKFAAETPFELTQLAKATNTLMGFGETADDADKHLRLIGDIAAVAGGDFQGITVAFGQVSAAGRMMGQDLLQLVNNGVPALDMLAKSMGVPKEKIKDLVSQGKVTFPVLVRAFEQATSKGGMFENGMIKLSRTSKGVYSTFKDNVNIALAKFGDEMQIAFGLTGKLEAFGAWIGRLADNFQRLEPETKRNILAIIGLVVVVGPLLYTFGKLILLFRLGILAFRGLALSFVGIFNPITFLIGLLVLLYTQWEDFRTVVDFLAASLINVFDNKYVKGFINDLETVYDWISKILGSGFSKFFKDSKVILDFVVEKIDSKLAKMDETSIGSNRSIVNPLTTDSSIANNQKTVNNNLTVNIPPGTSAADSTSIKNSIFAALAEQNRQSYIEVGAQ